MTAHAIAFGAVNDDASTLRDGILGRVVLVVACFSIWRPSPNSTVAAPVMTVLTVFRIAPPACFLLNEATAVYGNGTKQFEQVRLVVLPCLGSKSSCRPNNLTSSAWARANR
jgi:hypothetical protein